MVSRAASLAARVSPVPIESLDLNSKRRSSHFIISVRLVSRPKGCHYKTRLLDLQLLLLR